MGCRAVPFKLAMAKGTLCMKCGFFSKYPRESVSTEHLHGPEQDKMAQLFMEVFFIDRFVFAKSITVFTDEFLAQRTGKIGFGLPQE